MILMNCLSGLIMRHDSTRLSALPLFFVPNQYRSWGSGAAVFVLLCSKLTVECCRESLQMNFVHFAACFGQSHHGGVSQSETSPLRLSCLA